MNELHEAAKAGDVDGLARALASGADVDTRDMPLAFTSLHWAASSGHATACKVLIDHGASIEARDAFDMTPLHRAAKNGHRDIAEMLVSAGADIRARDEAGGTPLHVAAGEGQISTMQLLLLRGAIPEARDANGNTPLYWAATKGQKGACELLLGRGASPSTRNRLGRTPLDGARQAGHSETVHLLSAAGQCEASAAPGILPARRSPAATSRAYLGTAIGTAVAAVVLFVLGGGRFDRPSTAVEGISGLLGVLAFYMTMRGLGVEPFGYWHVRCSACGYRFRTGAARDPELNPTLACPRCRREFRW